ncbi:MAG: hypothetical protein V4472_25620 [Pseudomonadota bacterium]
MHQDKKDYRHREFERQMTHATRHSGGVGVHGEGVWCSCGEFVKNGDLHPWRVPATVEDNLEELLRRVPLSSYSPAVQEAVAAFRSGSSHPGLDQLAEECRAIEVELRDAAAEMRAELDALTEEEVSEHVSTVMFDTHDADPDCLLCRRGVELGVWARYGYPDGPWEATDG